MANDFSNAGSCLSVFNQEVGAIEIDSKGVNTLTNVNGVTSDISNYKQGSASGVYDAYASTSLSRADSDLTDNFPHKDGKTNFDFSVTAWFRWTLPYGYPNPYVFIWSKSVAGLQTWTGLGLLSSGGDAAFRVRFTGGTQAISKSANSVLDRWYHITSTYDHTARLMRMYVYDSVSATVVFNNTRSTGGLGDLILGAQPFTVGNASADGSYTKGWTGNLDEVTVWTRALTTDEIDEIIAGTYFVSIPTDPTVYFYPTSIQTATQYRVLPDPPEWPMEESLEWKTDIIKPTYSDNEQRMALRTIPRQSFAGVLDTISSARRRKVESLLHSRLKKKLGIPVWTEAELHQTTLTSGASSISIDTRYADFRDSSFGLLWKSETEYEILRIVTVTDSALTLSVNTQATYTGNKWIIPLRFGYVRGIPSRIIHNTDQTRLSIELECIDNEAVSGYVAAQTYDDLEVVDRPSRIVSDTEPMEYHDPDLEWHDNQVGLVGIQSNTDFNVVSHQHSFYYDTKAEIWDFRQWLHTMYGRQKSFLHPTNARNLQLSRDAGSGDDTIYIVNCDFVTYIGANSLLQYLGFRTTGGTLIVRKIDSVTAVSDAEESITLTDTMGTDFSSGDPIMFVHRCRLGNDKITLTWLEKDIVVCNVTMIRVTQ